MPAARPMTPMLTNKTFESIPTSSLGGAANTLKPTRARTANTALPGSDQVDRSVHPPTPVIRLSLPEYAP